MSKDYYEILGVGKTANEDEIKKAFRKLAHQHHPDKSGGDDAKFKEINEAYQVLGDKQKRSQYDQFGSNFNANGGFGGGQGNGFGGFDFSGFSGQGGADFDFGDIFEMFAGGGRSNRSAGKTKARRGSDIQIEIEVSFMEAAFGIEKEIKLKRVEKCDHCHGDGNEPGTTSNTCDMCNGVGNVSKVVNSFFGQIRTNVECERCSGTGKIFEKKCNKCSGEGVYHFSKDIKFNIPAGINTGEVLRVSGEGNSGIHGGGYGDLYIGVKIKNDKYFKRDGYNVTTELEISFAEAALGCKKDIKTVHGDISLKIPSGIQSNTVIKLDDKGIKKLHERGNGDHLVIVKVITPTKLSVKEKKIFEDLLKV